MDSQSSGEPATSAIDEIAAAVVEDVASLLEHGVAKDAKDAEPATPTATTERIGALRAELRQRLETERETLDRDRASMLDSTIAELEDRSERTAAPPRAGESPEKPPAGMFVGRVVDSDQGRPLPGIAVALRVAGSDEPALATAATDSTGAFALRLPEDASAESVVIDAHDASGTPVATTQPLDPSSPPGASVLEVKADLVPSALAAAETAERVRASEAEVTDERLKALRALRSVGPEPRRDG
jgi:hypothetical protein